MNWIDTTLDALAQQPAIGYLAGGAPAAEPTAVAALALAAHGRSEAAQQAAVALSKMQGESGAVGILAGEDSPGWPTGLAIVAWSRVGSLLAANTDKAIAWLLANRGKSLPRSAEFGHNTELVGWAYAEQTHSWVEPTAFAVLALKAAGQANSSAALEGVRVLLDRQLPGGGHNYGNTFVLGQLIRPHVQPSGIALLALAGAKDFSGRLAKSVAWLRRNIGPETTPLSLGWALLGLRAHGVVLPQADEWLAAAAGRNPPLSKLALLALAAKGWPA
jgi:hypothetical protein